MRVFLPFLLASALCFARAEEQEASRTKTIPREALTAWVAESPADYGGTYETLATDHIGSTRVILTYFHKSEPQISACQITREDLAEKPHYQITTLPADGKTGQLGQWKMVRYLDPATKSTHFGLEIDGQLFIDHSKTKKK